MIYHVQVAHITIILTFNINHNTINILPSSPLSILTITISTITTSPQPIMILAILPFTVAIEGSRVATSVSMLRYTSLATFLQTTALIAVGGVIAFVMEVGEYLLVAYTSSLTLSVAGICKEIISMTLAIIFQVESIFSTLFHKLYNSNINKFTSRPRTSRPSTWWGWWCA